MFKELHRKLTSIIGQVEDVLRTTRKTLYYAEDQSDTLQDIRTWVELLADTKADAVSEEFERLLESHIAAKQKLTNKALVALVHQAVLNTAK